MLTGSKRTLVCILCDEKHSVQDALNNRYFVETMVCAKCYRNMQRQPHGLSCFGKPTVILLSGKRLLGYDAKAEECEAHCPDRKVCCMVVLGKQEST